MHPVVLAYHFVAHTVVGVVLFSIVGGVAVLLNQGTILIEGTGVSPYIVLAIRGLEFFLFAADLVCTVVFVAVETLILLRDVVSSGLGGRHG
jgi:hypothetical protein